MLSFRVRVEKERKIYESKEKDILVNLLELLMSWNHIKRNCEAWSDPPIRSINSIRNPFNAFITFGISYVAAEHLINICLLYKIVCSTVSEIISGFVQHFLPVPSTRAKPKGGISNIDRINELLVLLSEITS